MVLEAGNVTTVSTPEGLREAVQNGALDILITEHLDLTTIPLVKTSICAEGCDSPLGEITATRSIRVRASHLCYPLRNLATAT